MNIKTIGNALAIMKDNPKLFLQGISAKLKSGKQLPANLTELEINGVKVRYRSEYDSYLNRLYYGTHDLAIRAIMKKLLRPGDTFIDIGGNIGRISTIALGLIGKAGAVHCFEPIPQYFKILQELAQDNPEYQFTNNNCALGEKSDSITMAVSQTNIGLNSLLPELLSRDDVQEKVEVPVMRLDDYIEQNRLDKIALIKIDTEGYEFPVLKGLSEFLRNSDCRPPIVCEITLEAYPLMNCTIEEFQDYMRQFDYRAYSIINPGKRIDLAKMKNNDDVIFLPGK